MYFLRGKSLVPETMQYIYLLILQTSMHNIILRSARKGVGDESFRRMRLSINSYLDVTPELYYENWD